MKFLYKNVLSFKVKLIVMMDQIYILIMIYFIYKEIYVYIYPGNQILTILQSVTPFCKIVILCIFLELLETKQVVSGVY